MFEPIAAETENVATQVMDAAFKVHRALRRKDLRQTLGKLDQMERLCPWR